MAILTAKTIPLGNKFGASQVDKNQGIRKPGVRSRRPPGEKNAENSGIPEFALAKSGYGSSRPDSVDKGWDFPDYNMEA